MDPGFWDRLLNQIRLFKRMGSKIVFFKTRIDARMTPDKKDHTPTHTQAAWPRDLREGERARGGERRVRSRSHKTRHQALEDKGPHDHTHTRVCNPMGLADQCRVVDVLKPCVALNL